MQEINQSGQSGDGQADMPTEIAGEATVESAPTERDSSDGENGLSEDDGNGIQLPGPAHEIDAPDGGGSTPAVRWDGQGNSL
jgi:hypothetical protein